MTVNKILPNELRPFSQETVEESLAWSTELYDVINEHFSDDYDKFLLSQHRECVKIALYVIQTLNLDTLLHQCRAEELFQSLRYKKIDSAKEG